MHHRTVADLMSHQVVTVGPAAPLKAVAATLADHGISAVPVVDDARHPIGMVSEGDLIRKTAAQPRPRDSGPRPGPVPREWVGSPVATAGETMSVPVVTARPDWTVAEAARAMERYRVKRLPVVDDGERLVGIVSRSDLLRIFLRSDTAIGEEINRDILRGALGLSPRDIRAEVSDGIVTLDGDAREADTVALAERLCWMVDGVVRVDNRLAVAAHPATSH